MIRKETIKLAKGEVKGLPVAGYTDQKPAAVDRVNENKALEERAMRAMDALKLDKGVDQEMLAIGRTQIMQGWMWVNRAIFKPTRVTLPEDSSPPAKASGRKAK